MKEQTYASRVVYTAVNNPHFQLPVSFFIAAMVARHGKYSRMKTIYDSALRGVMVFRTAYCKRVVSSLLFSVLFVSMFPFV